MSCDTALHRPRGGTLHDSLRSLTSGNILTAEAADVRPLSPALALICGLAAGLTTTGEMVP